MKIKQKYLFRYNLLFRHVAKYDLTYFVCECIFKTEHKITLPDKNMFKYLGLK